MRLLGSNIVPCALQVRAVWCCCSWWSADVIWTLHCLHSSRSVVTCYCICNVWSVYYCFVLLRLCILSKTQFFVIDALLLIFVKFSFNHYLTNRCPLAQCAAYFFDCVTVLHTHCIPMVQRFTTYFTILQPKIQIYLYQIFFRFAGGLCL